MRLPILVLLLAGCSKDYRIVQCALDTPSKCTTYPWPYTDNGCELSRVKNYQLSSTFTYCKKVSP